MRSLLSLSLICLGACSILPDNPPIPVYGLEGHYTASVQGMTSMVIERPQAVGRFVSRHMVIQESSGRQNTVANAQWADGLPKLLQNQMIVAFTQAGYVASRPDAGVMSSVVLQSDLNDFSLHRSQGRVVMSMTLRLVNSQTRHVMSSKVFVITSPTGEESVTTLVAAFNEAMSQLGDEMITWVHHEMGTSK